MSKPRWLTARPFHFDPVGLPGDMTSSASRRHLPDRRPNRTETIRWAGKEFSVSIGYWPDSGRPAETFVDGAREGSDLKALLADAAVLLSLLLQHNVAPAAIGHSLARVPVNEVETKPASVIGAVVELLAEGPDAEKTEAAP